MCPSCHSLKWTKVEMPLSGSIHSFVVAHYPQVPSFDYPLPILLVDLDPVDAPGGDKIRMVMNSADTDLESLVIGARVRIDIRSTDPEMKLPFAIVETSSSNGASA